MTVDYQSEDGVYIGGLVTLPDSTVGRIKDLWYKGKVYMAEVEYDDPPYGGFYRVCDLRPGVEDDQGL
jgi:hypothetical protein